MNGKPRNLCYIHPSQFPSERVSEIQVMRMCEGFNRAGCHPLLVALQTSVARTAQSDVELLFQYYGILERFTVELLPVPQPQRFGWPLRVAGRLAFALCAVCRASSIQVDVVYTRDPYSALLATEFGLDVIFEEHAPPQRAIYRLMRRRFYRSKNIIGIVFISQALQRIYLASGLLDLTPARTVVAHDAASTAQILSSTFRKPKELNHDGPCIIGYVGSLLPGRGIELILSIAEALPDFEFRIVGGTPEQINNLSKGAPGNVVWRGHVTPAQLLSEFNRMDVLLMPYQYDTSTHGGVHSGAWMSPLKMFEYMASGVPLIASDLPVLREVLISGHNSLLVPPDNLQAWVDAILLLARSPELGSRIADTAQLDIAQEYNWKTRALKILNSVYKGRSER